MSEQQSLKEQIIELNNDLEKMKNSAVTKEEASRFWDENRESRREMMDTVRELSAAIHEVKRDLDEFRESTKALVETFNSLQGLVNVLLWIGKVMKPLAVVAVGITGIVLYFQNFKFPGSK